MNEIVVGLVGETSQVVTTETTASQWGSGMVVGLSTPAMIGMMETAAFNATRDVLAAGQTTVGIEVNIKHLAATPVGMTVRARAELTRVEGKRLYFDVRAWDEVDKIGEGTHTRYIVDMARFDERLREKFAQAPAADTA